MNKEKDINKGQSRQNKFDKNRPRGFLLNRKILVSLFVAAICFCVEEVRKKIYGTSVDKKEFGVNCTPLDKLAPGLLV